MKTILLMLSLCVIFCASCASTPNQNNLAKENDLIVGLDLYAKLKGYPGGEMNMADYNLWSSFIIEYDTWRNSYSSKYGRKSWDEFSRIALEKHGHLHANLASRLSYP